MDKFSWPVAFLVSGAALALYGVVWQLFAGPALRHEPILATAETGEPEVDATKRRSTVDWTLLRRRDLWLVTLSYAAYGYFQYLFFYWMDYYFKSVLNVPNVDARQSTFIILLAQGVGMALGGWSTDGICRRLGIAAGRRAIVMTGMSLGAAFALAALYFDSRMEVTIALSLSMGVLGICEGVFWTTATDIGGRSRGFCGAFMNAGGNVGGLLSPVLTPAMAKSLGWPGAIAVACAISAVGGLVWMGIRLRQEAMESKHVEA